MNTSNIASTQKAHPVTRWLDERLGLQGLRYMVPEHDNSVPYLLGGISLVDFGIWFAS